MVNGPGPVWVERDGRLERRPSSCSTADHRAPHRADRGAARPPGRPHRARSSTPACPTARGSTPSCRRWPSTGPASPSAASAPAPIGLDDAAARRGSPTCSAGRSRPGATSSSPAAPGRARPRCSTPWPAGSRRASGSSPSRTPPSCACPATTSCGSRPGPANAEGVGAVTIRDLVRNALRMRPDRIVVGEVRGAEALDMLQAMNTGHEGSLSTCHANSPADALRRLETHGPHGRRRRCRSPRSASSSASASTSSCRSPGARTASGASSRSAEAAPPPADGRRGGVSADAVRGRRRAGARPPPTDCRAGHRRSGRAGARSAGSRSSRCRRSRWRGPGRCPVAGASAGRAPTSPVDGARRSPMVRRAVVAAIGLGCRRRGCRPRRRSAP